MSLAYWFSGIEAHRCGYCKNESGNVSNGMWTESLTVQAYQDLIDRGWRRSGKYCYKPIMDETCCPQYTIKCDTFNFLMSKSQKKLVKKFNKFIVDGILNNKDIPPEAQYDGHNSDIIFHKDRPNVSFTEFENKSSVLQIQENNSLIVGGPHCSGSNTESNENEHLCDIPAVNSSPQKSLNMKQTFKEGAGADVNKPPCKKAKLLRLERKNEKLLKNGLKPEKEEPAQVQCQKTVEQFLEEIPDNCKHKLRITLTRMTKYHELFTQSAKVFEKYQIAVHDDTPDECGEEQFYNFLVKTPLQPTSFPNGIDGPGYGSFHQQYWINDKLVAVGVIDILPKCVSSVYFFYDPDYRSLTLGTYGSLREVQFTRSLHKKNPELRYYYMGFYIHSCPKMRYKGKLVPSYLLCPETYHWVPIERCVLKLEVDKYSRLDEDIDAIDENAPTQKDIEEIKILHSSRLVFVRNYNRRGNDMDEFKQIGQLIGKNGAKNIIFSSH